MTEMFWYLHILQRRKDSMNRVLIPSLAENPRFVKQAGGWLTSEWRVTLDRAWNKKNPTYLSGRVGFGGGNGGYVGYLCLDPSDSNIYAIRR